MRLNRRVRDPKPSRLPVAGPSWNVTNKAIPEAISIFSEPVPEKAHGSARIYTGRKCAEETIVADWAGNTRSPKS